jgi:rare lipoprotein A (peptidoglycan hydrolase)
MSARDRPINVRGNSGLNPEKWNIIVSSRAERVSFKESDSLQWMLALSALFALMLAGCSSQNLTPAPSPASSYYAPAPVNYGGTRTEVASWYGPGFAGRRTSSGETYNPEGLTAASKTLPLGSRVRVTNPDTGRSVVVRINDRGPFVRGRSLDLSHGAAKQIGLTGKGVGRVQVTPTATSTPAASGNIAAYADSNPAPAPRHLSYASYVPRLPSVTSRLHHYRYSSYRSTSSRRMVSNPIGAWLSSSIPRL